MQSRSSQEMARPRKADQGFGSLFEEDYLVRTLGRIAHDPEIALTELVANAWDAGASLVDLTIPAIRHGALVVKDDGHGMTTAQFKGRWMAVRTGKGELVILDTSEALHLDHGYCTTVHAAQGRTCQRVLVDADVSSAMANESLYYVAISRARSEVGIYTDDRSMLPDAMARLDEKPAALDLDRPTSKRAAMAL